MSVPWRNPSAEDQEKYNVRPLPEDFEPTVEEQRLLTLYETVRSYERTSARLKEEAARARLEARQAQYNEAKSIRKTKRRRKKVQQESTNSGAEESGSDDDDEMSDDDGLDSEVDDEELRHRKKESKLAQLREEVEEKKEQQASIAQREDDIRQEYLTTKETDDVALARKTRDYDGAPQISLIDNLKATVTPPHDFSSKLELKPLYGKVLFPDNPESVEDYRWNPPQEVEGPNDGAFLVDLPDFNISRCQSGGNNTLAVKFTAPEKSKRFSINIASPDHNDFDSILFHFNPRQRERGGQLVVNDKQEGIWGSALAVPLSEMPLMFGKESVTLIIQINQEGFDIFVEGKHCARLEHRKELPSYNCNLVLQFPSSDDRGKPEDWTVYKVWWGSRPLMATGDVASVPGANSFNGMHPRKIFVSNLPRLSKQADLDLRRAELERAFRAYGGDRGVTVIVPGKKTYAFIEMESEEATERALREMAPLYRMNRARRTRHEALQEARAAAAQGGAP